MKLVLTLLLRWMLRCPAGTPLRFCCPSCGNSHVDGGVWKYRAHFKHLCAYCGYVWHPFPNYPLPTRGVL